MLWIAVLAYKDAAVDSFEVSRGDDLHKRLFAHYVDAMFRRRAIETRYQREETLRWLTWMARVLQRQNLTIFALEDLRPAWLPTRSQRVLARTMLFVGTMLGFSAVCFIVAWAGYLVSGGVTFIFNRAGIMRLPVTNWRAQLAYGLYIGGFASMLLAPVGGAIAAFTNLRPADRIQLGLAGIRKRLWQGAGVAVVTELLLWTVKRFIDTDADIGPLLVASPWPVAVAAGVLRMFLAETADARSRTNEGTRRSIRVAALLTSLTIVIALFAALRDGLHFWLAFSMIVAGLSGGLFAIRHMVLRAVLWLIRDAPFRYPRFLEYATARLFLRKAGGGFIFMHRMLLDYFASLPITRSRS
jgi:hypothetical protein